MARHVKQVFRNAVVALDGNEFEQCVFENCTLSYEGTSPVSLTGSRVNDCQWAFTGPAANAIQLMGELYRSGGHAALLVENTFNAIRGLPLPAVAAGQVAARPVN